jgi:hypothetical protein
MADGTSPAMLSHADAMARLSALCGERVPKQRLARLMRETPDHIDRPWLNVGHPDRARWKWDPTGIDRWFREVCAWQASIAFARRAESASRSDGARLQATRGRGRSTTSTRPKTSSARSKTRTPLAEIGSLQQYAKPQASVTR